MNWIELTAFMYAMSKFLSIFDCEQHKRSLSVWHHCAGWHTHSEIFSWLFSLLTVLGLLRMYWMDSPHPLGQVGGHFVTLTAFYWSAFQWWSVMTWPSWYEVARRLIWSLSVSSVELIGRETQITIASSIPKNGETPKLECLCKMTNYERFSWL